MGDVVYLYNKNEGIMMNNRITAKDLAYRFLCFEPMTQKKLQKLCYYAQAWYAALNNGQRLIPNDFEAWVHGPVCSELYDEFKSNGRMKIYPSKIPILSKDVEEHIVNTYTVYGDLDGNELESLTHSELPWLEARGNIGSWSPSRRVISIERMAEYYKSLLDKEK